MNYFGHPFKRVNIDAKTAAPFGRSPDGQWIVSAEDLPVLRWVKEDKSEKNKEWINGIVEAFQDALAGEL